MNTKNFSVAVRLVLIVLLGPLSSVTAQEAPGSNGSGDYALNEIVVTATKRAQNLQNVPTAISAFDSAYLQNNRVQEFTDLAATVPGLIANDGSAGAGVIAIRGISSSARGVPDIEQPVGVFIDGVTAPGSLDFLLHDIERVEVIRGPQGSIWGRNTLGGAVSFTTTRPGDVLSGYLQVGAGDFGFRDLRAAIGGPLIEDKLNARIALGHDERDGYTQRISGGTLGDIDRSVARVSLDWLASDDVSVALIVQRDESEFFNTTGEYFVGPLADFAGTDGFQRRIDTDFHEKSDSNSTTFTGIVSWDIGDYTFTSVTGHRMLDGTTNADSDSTNLPIVVEIVGIDTEQISQEFRLARDGALDGRIDLMIGLDYLKRDDFTHADVSEEGLAVELSFDNEVTSRAAFGALDFHLSDSWVLNTGFRVASEEKASTQTLDVPAFGIELDSGPRDLDDDQFSYLVGLTYNATDDLMLYANLGRGHKSGGFNDLRVTAGPFDNEMGDSYEAGLKATFFDNRAVFNASAFFIDYQDLQIRDLDGIRPVIINAGKAENKGVEIDLSFAATDGLDFTAALYYLDAKYVEFIEPGGQDFSGNRTANAPEWSANLSANYTRAFGNDNEFFATALLAYKDDYFVDFSNDPDSLQPSYTLINGRVGFRFAEKYELSLWGRNLSDEDYRVDFVTIGAVPSKQHVLGAPRTYGAEFRVSFGD